MQPPRLVLDRSRAAYECGDRDNGDAAARLALDFGSVEAGLLLVERWRWSDPELAETFARRAVALEAKRLWESDEAPAHRALSALLEARNAEQAEFVSLLRAAALPGRKETGDTKAVNRLVYWLNMFRFVHECEFPDLDGFIAEVRERWRSPHARFQVARALLAERETPARLGQAACIVDEAHCVTDAERTVQRHLAERLTESRE